MDVALIARYLALRPQLRQRERWPRERLVEHQQRRLDELRRFVIDRSPFYRRFHVGLEDRPLDELPILTKSELMANFDDVVTDRAIRLADVEAPLAQVAGDARFRGGYRVVSTSGTTGLRGIFMSSPVEWAHVIASYARAQEWAGIVPNLRHPIRVPSSARPSHGTSRRAWERASAARSARRCASMPPIRCPSWSTGSTGSRPDRSSRTPR